MKNLLEKIAGGAGISTAPDTVPDYSPKSLDLNSTLQNPPSALPRDVSGDLQKIAGKYSVSANSDKNALLPDTQGLQKMEYNPKTDDELAGLAQNRLADYYLNSVNALNENASAAAANLDKQKGAAALAAESKQAQLERVYAAALESVNNDAVKRGLARSSIAAGQVLNLESGKAAELYKIGAEHAGELYRLGTELDALEAKKEKALRDFDISYAAKLALEIDNLAAERDKKAAEVLKYNNDVARIEAQYAADKALNEQKIIKGEHELKGLSTNSDRQNQASKEMQDEVYGYLSEYLNSLSREAALNELLNNAELRKYVDTATFNKLYEEARSRG